MLGITYTTTLRPHLSLQIVAILNFGGISKKVIDLDASGKRPKSFSLPRLGVHFPGELFNAIEKFLVIVLNPMDE